jgi:hypothetical protein
MKSVISDFANLHSWVYTLSRSPGSFFTRYHTHSFDLLLASDRSKETWRAQLCWLGLNTSEFQPSGWPDKTITTVSPSLGHKYSRHLIFDWISWGGHAQYEA